jgi:hypothetical protein
VIELLNLQSNREGYKREKSVGGVWSAVPFFVEAVHLMTLDFLEFKVARRV